MTNMKKKLKFGVDIEVQQGKNYIKWLSFASYGIFTHKTG
jgi:hypothetical protein